MEKQKMMMSKEEKSLRKKFAIVDVYDSVQDRLASIPVLSVQDIAEMQSGCSVLAIRIGDSCFTNVALIPEEK